MYLFIYCGVGWMDSTGRFALPKDISMSEIFVPTIDTVRNSCIIKLLINQHANVLITGETGTGKSALIQSMLQNGISELC